MISLLEAELFRVELTARMPFRYGIATMTEVPQVFLRLKFDLGGRIETGISADALPPKWFTKDPQRGLADEINEMLQVIRAAVRHAKEVRAPTPFAFWREVFARQSTWADDEKLPPLLSNFGTTFIERALIHAVCRSHRASLSAVLQSNALGIELAAMQPSLAGMAPRDYLPAVPPAAVFIRQTVGLADPIVAGDLPENERVHDGLPQTLEECIRFYGLRHFKIKINGEAARDRDRLTRMASVLARAAPDYAFSLDGNESFRDVASFADYYRNLRAAPELRSLWSHLMYLEQPWHRDVALSPAMQALGRDWPDRPPIIIDESDGEIDSLSRALALGYAGTSHKNCKGVFKSVINAGLLAQRRAAGEAAVLSGEDLVNTGPVALIQDLAAQSALGVTSVERNGHHYFKGLAQFPRSMQEHALRAHPDLYTKTADGWPRLNIRSGQIAMGSINAAPFGVPGELDLSGLAGEALAIMPD